MGPSQQLINYIQQNKNLGYGDAAIRSTLQNSGYSQKDIDAAMSYMASGGAEPKSSPILLIAIILVGVVFLFGAVAMFMTEDTPLDDDPVYNPPDDFEGPDNSEDDTDVPIDEEEIPVPDDSDVEIPEDEQEEEVSEESSSDSGSMTRFEIDRKVAALATTDPDAASLLCEKISTHAGQLSCYHKIAGISQNEKYCEKIDDAPAKDSCYVALAIAQVGTVDICKKIQDEFKSRSCLTLYGASSYQLSARPENPENVVQNGSTNQTRNIIETPPLARSEIEHVVVPEITKEEETAILNSQISALDGEETQDTQLRALELNEPDPTFSSVTPVVINNQPAQEPVTPPVENPVVLFE